jgi:membrane-bound lytic murein transglycosylase B
MSFARIVVVALLAGGLGAGGAAADAKPSAKGRRADKAADGSPAYRGHAELQRFADEVAQRHGWDSAWVLAQLEPARRVPLVARLIMPPPAGTAKNWAAYRDRFVTPDRIAAGLAFWSTHATVLQRAEDEFGVPAEIVAAIIGVETFYGRMTGGFRVLDALATLSFDFPPGRKDRSAFFRSELEELLVLCRREGIAAASLKGSYAGAMGLPQFMPGSINRHARDYDRSGEVDLLRSPADAIGSVAAYLAAHGWQRGMPTHYAVRTPVDSADRAVLLGPDILPTFSAAQFAERGAVLAPEGAAHTGPMALVELQNGEAAPSYVAGTQNFYAITRYNWSSYYAMAVIDLGHALRTARQQTAALQTGRPPEAASAPRER